MKPERLHTSIRSGTCPIAAGHNDLTMKPCSLSSYRASPFRGVLPVTFHIQGFATSWYSPFISLSYYIIFCELQQQLFRAGIPEGHRGLGILARAFHLDNRPDAKALVLNDIALLESDIAY